MQNDTLSQFRNAMFNAGLNPPQDIEPGKFHRFPGVGKSNGNTAGWCTFFNDGLGGCFGDWSSDLFESWFCNQEKPMPPIEKQAFQQRLAEARVKAEKEREAKQAEAAQKALVIWNKAIPAEENHPYLLKKDVGSHGLRQYQDDLVVPLYKEEKLFSLQYISASGFKQFLTDGLTKGCHFFIGPFEGDSPICIVEGYATGASIFEATGYPVCVAFNAGNLEAVAKAIREMFSSRKIILCADDDWETENNPGLTKAREAALLIGALMVFPDFGEDRPQSATDFNDLGKILGIEEVRDQIAGATFHEGDDSPSGITFSSNESDWPQPQPLVTQTKSEPYPLDAFPDPIRCAIEEVQGFTKAPIPLVASSALAGLSLAIQPLVDIKRAEKLLGPVGLFLLTIADSGERKSTCDGFFTSAIKEYEKEQAELGKPILSSYRSDIAVWEAKKAATLDKIRQESKEGKNTEDRECILKDLEDNKPEAPRIPRILRTDETPENLAWALSHEWPSAGIVSAEAGIVFGAHGMGKDSIMRNLALLNTLWDGGVLPIGRKSSESFTVKGARLTVALQVQEATLDSFFEKSGTLARGTGFLSRFLLTCPESTQGFRPFTEPPENWPALECFNRRITEILNEEIPINNEGCLEPDILDLSPDAKSAWIAFHDSIEKELVRGGQYNDVRDVASKIADNAARISALFHVFEYGINCPVELKAFQGASRLASWYLDEARRFFGEFALPPELSNPSRLDCWLVGYCREKGVQTIPRREVQRNVTPVNLRNGTTLDAALQELVEAGRIRLVNEGRRKEIQVNPLILNES